MFEKYDYVKVKKSKPERKGYIFDRKNNGEVTSYEIHYYDKKSLSMIKKWYNENDLILTY